MASPSLWWCRTIIFNFCLFGWLTDSFRVSLDPQIFLLCLHDVGHLIQEMRSLTSTEPRLSGVTTFSVSPTGSSRPMANAFLSEPFSSRRRISPLELVSHRQPLWLRCLGYTEHWRKFGSLPSHDGPDLILDFVATSPRLDSVRTIAERASVTVLSLFLLLVARVLTRARLPLT